ncbi:MAG: sugar ABC transporter ATP-binding protein [Lachnospiraceae bacterium]|jgi:ribose transport system ATP-binding protein|nr:sugar ABC transporter ATP-binding protein [Lachnospiraceae bacterium]
MDDHQALSLRHITKRYPGVVALDDVSLDFAKGEVHAIVGENGAGKSTFIKVITGAVRPDAGSVAVRPGTGADASPAAEYPAMTPALARSCGIECIYQEFNLVDCLSAAENICFGTRLGALVDQNAMNQVARGLFDEFGIDIDPSAIVRDLSSAQKQIVEIAKAVSKKPRVLILDEPTASLTVSEISILFGIVERMKKQGATLIYISHRLEEIFAVSDRVSVLRDGRLITTLRTGDCDRQTLIKHMVGRELSETYPARTSTPGALALELKRLSGNGVRDISFGARRGEILGVAGLVGAGRSEIMKVVFGAERRQWGEVLVNGVASAILSPSDAMRLGISLIPEDRKTEGCFLMDSIRSNIVYNILKKISGFFVVDQKKEAAIARDYIDRMRIKTPSPETKVLTLSGGNQQKVVVAKALASESDIIIFDEPTRGIDVGAKHEIYELMNELCSEGKCIVMVTSDMEELLGMSDRIVVFAERTLAGELGREQFSQEAVLELASGG